MESPSYYDGVTIALYDAEMKCGLVESGVVLNLPGTVGETLMPCHFGYLPLAVLCREADRRTV